MGKKCQMFMMYHRLKQKDMVSILDIDASDMKWFMCKANDQKVHENANAAFFAVYDFFERKRIAYDEDKSKTRELVESQKKKFDYSKEQLEKESRDHSRNNRFQYDEYESAYFELKMRHKWGLPTWGKPLSTFEEFKAQALKKENARRRKNNKRFRSTQKKRKAALDRPFLKKMKVNNKGRRL